MDNNQKPQNKEKRQRRYVQPQYITRKQVAKKKSEIFSAFDFTYQVYENLWEIYCDKEYFAAWKAEQVEMKEKARKEGINHAWSNPFMSPYRIRKDLSIQDLKDITEVLKTLGNELRQYTKTLLDFGMDPKELAEPPKPDRIDIHKQLGIKKTYTKGGNDD